jgi:hypothetical protein
MSEFEKWNSVGKVCGHCAAMQYTECTHVRGGKTKHDHATGAHGNRFSNRALRTEWLQDAQTDNKAFPRYTCNGQKNRFAS